MKVFDDGNEEDDKTNHLRASRHAERFFAQRKTHCDEAVESEGDQNPDGGVRSGVEEEFFDATGGW